MTEERDFLRFHSGDGVVAAPGPGLKRLELDLLDRVILIEARLVLVEAKLAELLARLTPTDELG